MIKLIDLRTIKGIERAERLQRNGWEIIANSLDMVQMEKKEKTYSKAQAMKDLGLVRVRGSLGGVYWE